MKHYTIHRKYYAFSRENTCNVIARETRNHTLHTYMNEYSLVPITYFQVNAYAP